MYPHGVVDAANLPEIPGVRALIAVADHGSIAAAARFLNENQQTISARVAKAEKRLKITVFHRTPYGSATTPKGEEALTAARSYLAAADTFAAQIRRLAGESANQGIAVAVSHTVAELFFPAWAAEYHRTHRDSPIELRQLNSAKVQAQVLGGQAPLGFIEGAEVSNRLQSVVIGVDDLVLAVPAEHSLAKRSSPVSKEELRSIPLILREEGSGTREVVEEALSGTAPPVAELGSLAAQRAGIGAFGEPSIIAAKAIGAQVKAGEIVVVPVKGVRFRREIRAVFDPHNAPPREAMELLKVARTIGL